MTELNTENFEYIMRDLRSSHIRPGIVSELADHLAVLTENLMQQAKLDFETAYHKAKQELDTQDVLELNQSLFYYQIILNKPLIRNLGIILLSAMIIGMLLKFFVFSYGANKWFVIPNLLISYAYLPLLALHLFTRTHRKLVVLLLFMSLLATNFYVLAFILKWSARSYLKWPAILFITLLCIHWFSTKKLNNS